MYKHLPVFVGMHAFVKLYPLTHIFPLYLPSFPKNQGPTLLHIDVLYLLENFCLQTIAHQTITNWIKLIPLLMSDMNYILYLIKRLRQKYLLWITRCSYTSMSIKLNTSINTL